MNLVESMMEDFVLLEKTRADDGEGGWVTAWKDGIRFDAAATLDTTMQARIGEAQGVSSVYTITTRRPAKLEFHDVIRRLSDGAVFRITSNASEKQSPKFGTLDLSQCSAERWVLPT